MGIDGVAATASLGAQSSDQRWEVGKTTRAIGSRALPHSKNRSRWTRWKPDRGLQKWCSLQAFYLLFAVRHSLWPACQRRACAYDPWHERLAPPYIIHLRHVTRSDRTYNNHTSDYMSASRGSSSSMVCTCTCICTSTRLYLPLTSSPSPATPLSRTSTSTRPTTPTCLRTSPASSCPPRTSTFRPTTSRKTQTTTMMSCPTSRPHSASRELRIKAASPPGRTWDWTLC